MTLFDKLSTIASALFALSSAEAVAAVKADTEALAVLSAKVDALSAKIDTIIAAVGTDATQTGG